jgi:hypothetical protein
MEVFFKNYRNYSLFCTRIRLYQRFVQPFVPSYLSTVLRVAYRPGSASGGHFSKRLAGYNIGNVQQFLKKYLQCVLAARILTVDFVVCTIAVKKKSGQVSTCRIGPLPCQSLTEMSTRNLPWNKGAAGALG